MSEQQVEQKVAVEQPVVVADNTPAAAPKTESVSSEKLATIPEEEQPKKASPLKAIIAKVKLLLCATLNKREKPAKTEKEEDKVIEEKKEEADEKEAETKTDAAAPTLPPVAAAPAAAAAPADI